VLHPFEHTLGPLGQNQIGVLVLLVHDVENIAQPHLSNIFVEDISHELDSNHGGLANLGWRKKLVNVYPQRVAGICLAVFRAERRVGRMTLGEPQVPAVFAAFGHWIAAHLDRVPAVPALQILDL